MPLSEAELKAKGLIRVSRGPFGIFGDRVMSIKTFQREQNRLERAKIRADRRKKARRKAALKRAARKALVGKKKRKGKKKKRWIIPGILYH